MRLILLTALSSILFFSCEKDELTPNADTSAIPQTKSASIPNPIDQLAGMPVNIKVVGTVPNNYNFLSSTNKNNNVDRHSVDDGSSRQRWYISKYNGIGLKIGHSIKVVGGAKVNGYINFNGGPDQFKLILNNNERGFNLYNIANTSNYYIYSGSVLGTSPYSHYLYAKDSDREVVFKNNISILDQRVIWEITPVENLELLDIKYLPIAGKKFNPILDLRKTRKIENMTGSSIKHTLQISETVKESSSFSKTEGLSVTNKISIKASVGIPLISESEVSAEHTTAKTWSFQESTTTEVQRTIQDNYEIIIPPYTTTFIDVSIVSYNIDVEYVATFKGVDTGKIIYLKGKWKGVECTGIDYKAHDSSGNPINLQGLRNLKL